jgi:hypothetical protein
MAILYTYKEALERYGSRHAVLKQVGAGRLFLLQRNLYSTDRHIDPLVQTMKRYPRGIITGFTAFYIHGLTDRIPERIDLATPRNMTRISDPAVKQHFMANDLFEVGASMINYESTNVRVYDKETMLFYLLHYGNKLPFDLYKEVMKSYRGRAHELDYNKLQRYASILPGGRRNLERIIKEVL